MDGILGRMASRESASDLGGAPAGTLWAGTRPRMHERRSYSDRRSSCLPTHRVSD